MDGLDRDEFFVFTKKSLIMRYHTMLFVMNAGAD